jgi:hypothetical protein
MDSQLCINTKTSHFADVNRNRGKSPSSIWCNRSDAAMARG